MSVAILAATADERRALAEALGAVRSPITAAEPDRLERVLDRPDLAVAVVEHTPDGPDGLELAADLLRCRPGVRVVLVAHGGDELLAAEAIKRGLADYVPRTRLDLLGPSVRGLLAARPVLVPEQALRDRDEQLRLVLRAARLGAWEWDLLSGTIRSVLIDEAFGMPPGTCGPTFEGYVRLVHPDDRDAFRARVGGILAGADAFPLEYRIDRPDGKTRWIYSTGEVERVGPRAVYLRGVAMDRTEERQLTSRRQRADRLEGLGLVVGGIAHDLSNALTPVQLSIYLLRRHTDAARREAVLDTIEASVKRAVALLRQVLDFARGQDTGGHGVVDLAGLLTALEADLGPTLPPGVTLSVDVAAGLSTVWGDAEQLSRMLRQLTANAVEAMPAGGRLTVRAEGGRFDGAEARAYPGAKEGRHVLVRVSDTGEGIAAGVVERIFDPFFTTRPGHTGLGLSEVRGIVRRHQAALDVASDPGGGAVFRVWLPADAPAAGG